MRKGFLLGMTIGAAAAMIYEASNKAKKGIEKGKNFVKEKISEMMD